MVDILTPALDAEQQIVAEEASLMQRAKDLERQVLEHKQRKEAALLARQQAEEQRQAEEEMEQWAQQLRAEVEKTIERLNVQRTQQIARCQQFDNTLQANIEAMQQMQQQVRRRQAALDAAFDAATAKLTTAHIDAVAVRRQQAAEEAARRASAAAGKAAALPALPPMPPLTRPSTARQPPTSTLPPGAAALSHALLADVDIRHMPVGRAAAPPAPDPSSPPKAQTTKPQPLGLSRFVSYP